MKGNKPSSKALEKVKIAFYRACRYDKFITLHIDDGRLGGGGGEALDHISPITWSDFTNNYFNVHFDRKGKHIFHYCLFTDEIYGAGGISAIGRFMVSITDNAYKPGPGFMHELGHAIGLHGKSYPGGFDGVDSNKYSLSQYPSVMNYNAAGEKYYDYSPGPDSSTNHDDWGHLDLGENLPSL